MKIVDNFVMPANAVKTSKRGSKYFPIEVQETMEALKTGQGFIFPKLDEVDGKRQTHWTEVLSKAYFKESGKIFAFGTTAEGTAILCKNDAIPADDAKNDEAPAEN